MTRPRWGLLAIVIVIVVMTLGISFLPAYIGYKVTFQSPIVFNCPDPTQTSPKKVVCEEDVPQPDRSVIHIRKYSDGSAELMYRDHTERRPDGSEWKVRYDYATGDWKDLQQVKAAPAPVATTSPRVSVPQPPAPQATATAAPRTAPAPQPTAPAQQVSKRHETGVGNTLHFANGAPVYGWQIQLDGQQKPFSDCYFDAAPAAGTVTDGVTGEVYPSERKNPCK